MAFGVGCSTARRVALYVSRKVTPAASTMGRTLRANCACCRKVLTLTSYRKREREKERERERERAGASKGEE